MADHERLLKLLSFAICGGNATEGVNGEDIHSDVHNTCYELMARDFRCGILNNSQGQLCSTYPTKIIVPIPFNETVPTSRLTDLVHKCRFARTRGRFVIPVLLIDGKYVCRSSTLARSPEIYCRSGYGYWIQGEAPTFLTEPSLPTDREVNGLSVSDTSNGNEPGPYCDRTHSSSDPLPSPNAVDNQLSDSLRNKEWMLDKVRNADINLLRFLKVDTIFDLMVEKKKVKFGMNVTSSEKVDRQQRYLKFNLLGIPYPGCEFFAEYRDCGYEGEGLMFDWKQNFVDADLCVPGNVTKLPEIDWKDYVNWDLIKLTQNYLKLQLHLLMCTESTGILLHCISGWDRTPLFVSLVRLSLWADGLVHQSLTAEEVIYFTVAYDWFLFSHQFPDRISKGEEIFYFCFDFLKYIECEEFSMVRHLQRTSSSTERGARSVPKSDSSLRREAKVLERDDGKCLRNGNVPHCSKMTVSSLPHLNTSGVKNNSESSKEGPMEHDVAIMSVNESGCWSPKVNLSADVEIEGDEQSCEEEWGNSLGNLTVHDVSSNNGHAHSGASSNLSSILTIPIPNNIEKNQMGNDVTTTNIRKESLRAQNLKRARAFILPAYHQALREYQDREQQGNTGFAAVLLNHLSRTLNLVKR